MNNLVTPVLNRFHSRRGWGTALFVFLLGAVLTVSVTWSGGVRPSPGVALGLLFSLLLGLLVKLLIESRMHQEELAALVTQRSADFLASKNQLAAMLEAIPDPMWELGLDGRCHGCHSWRVESLATFMLELIGHTVREKFPAAAADTIMAALSEADANGSSHGREIELQLAQERLWFELSVACKTGESGQEDRFIVLARDITERKRAEALERRRRDDLLAMYLLSNAVSNAESIEQVYADAMDSLLQMLKADRVAILLLDADGVMRFKAWRGLSDGYRQAAEGYSPWPADAVDPRPVLIDNVEPNSELTHLAAARAEGVSALGFIPLLQHGRLLGRFMVYFNAPHHFADDEIQLATTLAFHVAMAIVRKRTETDLRIAATAFESQEGMLITDANNVILRVNQAFVEMTGYSAAEAVGQTPRLLRSERHDAAFYTAMWKYLEKNDVWQGELWNRRKNGEVFPSLLTITAVKGHNGAITHYVGSQLDITERKAAEEKIDRLAFFDPLTELPNRRLQIDRLQQAMAASVRNKKHGALLFLDLDNFKTLNETLGHEIGDMLLQQVAQRLLGCVRQGDTVARLGGDEFVVILQDLSENSEEAAAQTEVIGEKIRETLGETYMIAGQAQLSTPSIGVTLFAGHDESIDELMKQADLALYQAKAAGRNTLRFFDPDMQTRVLARARLDADLREAMAQDQFVLHYQPQIDATAGVIGAEVLLRWRHPRRGMVLPSEFISRAEDTGLILPLGHWVLKTAIAQLATWATRPNTAHLILAVNVNVQQFSMPNFVDDVLALIDQFGANPRRLKLELTESLLMENADDVIAKMTALKARGVSFSLDDFGTGYSSLAYLKRLPLAQLKIDQSFVRDVATNPGDAVIANAIIALANSMGMSVIAEGVETEAHRYFLSNHGCQVYQGYLFSRPLPLDEFQHYLGSFTAGLPQLPLGQC